MLTTSFYLPGSLFACHGECPKNCFARSPDGEAGLNYLCPNYRKYFAHITQAMNAMAQLVSHGFRAAAVKDAFKGPLMLAVRCRAVRGFN